MTDPATLEQTKAAIEQAHAAWAQVYIGAVSALMTLAAVVTALGIPVVQWWRQKSFTEATLFQAARAIVSLHEKLETNLLNFNPWGGLSVIRVARQRLEHTIPIVREYRMITCLLALLPIIDQTEKELERWTRRLNAEGNFDIDSFRGSMLEQSNKAKTILTGYGNRGLERKLNKMSRAFP